MSVQRASNDWWFLSGPTACGKSAVGVELAAQLGAEILSLDSMALYRGLDIGTAKPTQVERAAAEHHLLDLVEPEQEFSLSQYVRAARAAAAGIEDRGRQALFVGGTPLYLKGLLRGLFEGPPPDWDWRQQMAAEAARQPPGWLHGQLTQADPATAVRLHPKDQRRLLRALEVLQKTGRPLSAWQREFDQAQPANSCRVFVLERSRHDLAQRIERRVDAMFAAGLVAEVQSLLAAGRSLGRTASQAVGYKEVLAHVRGDGSLKDAIALVKLRTRQLAKRQLTWFRSLCECRWIPCGEQQEAAEIADAIRLTGESGNFGHAP